MPRRNYPNQPFKSTNYHSLLVNCDHKTRYRTESEAQAAKEHQELMTIGLVLRIYKCNIAGCYGYHLTRNEKKSIIE